MGLRTSSLWLQILNNINHKKHFVMYQSTIEIKKRALEDIIYSNRWWPMTKLNVLKYIEKFGVPIAFSMRGFPLLRTNLGRESFTWSMMIFAFVWFRIWVAIIDSGTHKLAIINPYILEPLPAGFLSYVSYLFLVLCTYYKLSAKLKFGVLNKDIKSTSRGSAFLFKIKGNGKSIVDKEWFKQAVVDPSAIVLTGLILLLVEGTFLLGLFFLISGALFAFDEFNYHGAKGNKLIADREGIHTGKKNMEEHEKRDEANPDGGDYDIN